MKVWINTDLNHGLTRICGRGLALMISRINAVCVFEGSGQTPFPNWGEVGVLAGAIAYRP